MALTYITSRTGPTSEQRCSRIFTGRSAVINCGFVDMSVEVPGDVGPDAPCATWKLNGTLKVTTSEGSGAEPLAP